MEKRNGKQENQLCSFVCKVSFVVRMHVTVNSARNV